MGDRRRNWDKRNPWIKYYKWAKRRCEDPEHRSYKWYGGRGIKFSITLYELKVLWLRDGAEKMEKPSLDRINPDEHYEFYNCRFVPLKENCSGSRHYKRIRGEK